MPDPLIRTSLLNIGAEKVKDIEKPRKFLSNGSYATEESDFNKCPSIKPTDALQKTLQTCRELDAKYGIYSVIAMDTAGFQYTKNGDEARCATCGLQISRWTADMIPFNIHKQRSPMCSFVLSKSPPDRITTDSKINAIQTTSPSDQGEQPLKELKTDTTVVNVTPNILVETETLKQVRKRTFSHWPHRSSPSSAQMIEAGFFNCNVGDRVICIYCNLICQQWTPNSDDPYEVHKTLSPKCSYVMAKLTPSQTTSISIINETSTSVDPFRCHEIVYTAACNTNYIEIPKRYASFANWPNENLPPVDDLVRAGFFFTGTKTIVTCFYCNGSLQNWGSNDKPMIEHARWFPHCAYAKQLCGTELHRKIQESKRAQQERATANDSSNRSGVGATNLSDGRLVIPDESTLSRLVAARLDLPISQSLLDRNFKLSIIKRCWEDQLRLKHDDFVSDCDLLMACTILQKQIEHIDGKKENITVPSVAMKRVREKEQAGNSSRSRTNADIDLNDILEAQAREQVGSGSSSINSSDSNDVEMTVSSTGSDTTETEMRASTATTEEIKGAESSSTKNAGRSQVNSSSPADPCVLCLEEEKRLACMPCGHLATCVPCGHSLRSCPICRRSIDAFVRIYL